MGGLRVFVSYRRNDSRHVAGRLADHVSWQQGVKHVFLDTRSIPPGTQFPARLEKAVRAATHTLVVIGPNWTGGVPTGQAVSRIFDETDFVRREVATALAGTGQVIPVLVDDAEMPKSAEVPENLRPLLDREAYRVHNDRAFDDDVRQLLRHVTGGEPRGGDTGWSIVVKVVVGAAAGMLIFLAFSAIIQFGFGYTADTLFGTRDVERAVMRWQLLKWGLVAAGAVLVPIIRRRWRVPRWHGQGQ